MLLTVIRIFFCIKNYYSKFKVIFIIILLLNQFFFMLCIFSSLLQFQMCSKIWWLVFYVRTITNYDSLSSFYFLFFHSIFLSLSLYFVSPLILALHTGLLVTDHADSQNVNMYLNLNECCDTNWLFHLLLICFSCINKN